MSDISAPRKRDPAPADPQARTAWYEERLEVGWRMIDRAVDERRWADVARMVPFWCDLLKTYEHHVDQCRAAAVQGRLVAD
ncbi:MAG TPA: hypothetical protein VF041_23270 [Gemmatimonadaceae bacterium]